MGGEEEGVGGGQCHGEREHRRVGAGADGDVDRQRHQQHGGTDIGHHQGKQRRQHSNGQLQHPGGYAAKQAEGLLGNPGGGTAGLHREAQWNQAGQQEYRFPAHRLIGVTSRPIPDSPTQANRG